jgi:mannose-6-phosphate isomerase-like protein (cupin superfamily)
MVEVSDASAKPVPKSPVEVVDTSWEPGERNVKRLAHSELLSVLLHHWDTGGEVGLHHHTDGDATWVVQEGEVTFYGEDDEVLARAGRNQAVLVPRNTMYWFENSGEGPLAMFRISARVGGTNTSKDDRVYHKRG